jgi:predicted PurR-regulated permease PerM
MTESSLDRHVWEYAWVRDLLLLGCLALVGWTAVQAAPVTIPLALGLTVAYATQPVVRWMDRHLHVPRWTSAILMLLVIVGGFTAALLYVLPDLYAQGVQLFTHAPAYFDKLAAPLGLHWADVRNALDRYAPVAGTPPPLPRGMEQLKGAGEMVAQWAAFGFGLIARFIGTTVGLAIALLVWSISFVTFSMRLERLGAWAEGFIPADRRDRVLRILQRMDKSVAGNLRGRMIQSMFLVVELCIGWKLAGVRYWLLLGLVVGLMNLVPYISLLGSPLVVALNWADKTSTGEPVTLWATFALPVAIHMAGQFLDGWVVEPLVQSRATNLHGITVLISVMIGGSLFGLFGMVAAVPIAACLKILGEEVLIPSIKAWLRNASSHVQT